MPLPFPTVALEFECKHGDFTDHNLTRPDDEQEHADSKDREINLNGCFAKPYRERTPKEGVGGCGKADEGMTLACVEVEFCQPQRRKSRNQKRGVRENHTQGARAVGTAPGVLAEQREDHRCRSYSEVTTSASESSSLPMGLATPSRRAAKPSKKQNGTEYNKEEGHRQCAAHGIVDGNAAADEIAAGDGVGNMLFHNERGL